MGHDTMVGDCITLTTNPVTHQIACCAAMTWIISAVGTFAHIDISSSYSAASEFVGSASTPRYAKIIAGIWEPVMRKLTT